MNDVVKNPVKTIRKFNLIAFILLFVSILIYQVTILLENHYMSSETLEFDLGNQDRLLSQQIRQNLDSSLTAPDYLSRDRYINKARQDINILSSNHNSLLDVPPHTPLFRVEEGIVRNVYEEAGFYLEQMRDAVFSVVAYHEKLALTESEQQLLQQSVKKYRENQQNFASLIDRATELSRINAQRYRSRLPWLSWSLAGLVFVVMLINHRLIYERSVTTAKKQFKALEQRLEFQNALLNSTHEAIITLSSQGSILLFSTSAQRMFGYAADEIINKSIRQLMTESVVEIKVQKLEIQSLRKDGSSFPALLQLEELKTPHQHLFIGFIRDLTSEKQAEIKLLKAKKEAEEANKAKSQFLSNISHELKTPLNAILGFSQLLETDDAKPLSPGQSESVQHIYKAGKLLLALIGDVLELSKIETGNVKLNCEAVSVNELILEALLLIENIAKQHNIQIKTRFDPLAMTMINVDPLRFKQVLINLLSNAVKYNSENGSITLRSKIENNLVKISVKDSGIGIDESKLMDLFQPFNRLGAEKSEVEGTGIGLCIAKNLVERMGGSIGALNNKGAGCCFWVEFPVVLQKASLTEHASDVTEKLQNEFAYLQESLNTIGLVKNRQPYDNSASQVSNGTEAEFNNTTFH